MTAIKIENLTKKYGTQAAVTDFNLTAEKGELIAVVGPDGAGKTSLFRCICGLLSFDSGSITILGHDAAKEFANIKPLLGYMPQNFSLYPDLSVEENLDFYAGLFGLEGQELESKTQSLYRFSGLGPFKKRRAGKLSGGMKQKLALSCSLVHDPEILILDEPTTGVDPVSRRQFWDILKTLQKQGSTILVSTPYMDEVALADRAIFMFDGKYLTSGTPRQLVEQFKGEVYEAAVIPSAENMRKINGIEGMASRRFGGSLHLYPGPGRTIEQYLQKLGPLGITADNISRIAPDLEDTFIQFMER